jgi:hypothetical protein
MRRIRKHLTYANVMVTILAFVVLGGGTALAAVVINSNSQVAKGTISGHKPPSGKHANIIAGSINGTDIADRSGVDTCQTPLVAKFGPICAGSDGVSRTWTNALDYCAGFGLRLPTIAEGVALAKNYRVPGGGKDFFFWTEDAFNDHFTGAPTGGYENANVVTLSATTTWDHQSVPHRTVCVTDPSA